MNIRTGTPTDAPAIASFQVAHALEVENMELDLSVTLEGVQKVFKTPPLGFYLVAEAPTGDLCACLLVLSEWSDWRAREVWWIHSVFVVPQARGNRLFDAMYAHVETLARASGAAGLRLYVDRRNTTARRVYERLGMSNAHYELFERMF